MSMARILRFDRFERSSDAVRIKAVIVSTIVLNLLMLADIVYLLTVEGLRWEYVVLPVVAIGLISSICLSFKFHRKFFLAGLGFAITLSVLIFLGASVDHSGIESALVFFLPLTIVLAGFTSGWRMTIITGCLALAVSVMLFHQTAMHTGDGSIGAALSNSVLLNKFIQLLLSCIVATSISAYLSVSMHGLFKRDEENVEKVQHAERQRTAFLSSLSHEIRTPLNGIIGMSALLKHTNLNAQQQQYTNMVNECGENLLEVLGTVMEFNQINFQKLVLNEETVDIHQLAHDVVGLYAKRLPQGSDVIMGLHIAEQVPQFLQTDKSRIETVLKHILRNAVNFTPQGSINVLLNGSEETDGKFRLSVYVRDTGVGIRQAQLKEIYQPFHQLDNELTRKHEGTGLGLSLCKEIIEFMGGKLDVVSEFGAGSTFFFEVVLPIKSAEISHGSVSRIDQASDLSNVAIFRKAS